MQAPTYCSPLRETAFIQNSTWIITSFLYLKLEINCIISETAVEHSRLK